MLICCLPTILEILPELNLVFWYMFCLVLDNSPSYNSEFFPPFLCQPWVMRLTRLVAIFGEFTTKKIECAFFRPATRKMTTSDINKRIFGDNLLFVDRVFQQWPNLVHGNRAEKFWKRRLNVCFLNKSNSHRSVKICLRF